MHCDHHERRQRRGEWFAAILGDPHRRPEQRAGGGCAERDDGTRLDERDLLFQPGAAGEDLFPIRLLVDAVAPPSWNAN